MLTIILWRMLWLVVSEGITILQFGPRPKTSLRPAMTDWTKGWLGVYEKFIEFFNIDIMKITHVMRNAFLNIRQGGETKECTS